MYKSIIKELNTGKDWVWIAKTPNNKYIKDFVTLSLKSQKCDKAKKEKDQETVNSILAVSATGKDDKKAYNDFLKLLKTKKGFSDKQIEKLDIVCIPLKDLKSIAENKLQEQKQLRLDVDDYTANLASGIVHSFEWNDDFVLKQSIDTVNVHDKITEDIICEILFWNKKYTIFTVDSDYYYIGKSVEEFEKDFSEVYENYLYEMYNYTFDYLEADPFLNSEKLLEYTKASRKENRIVWVDNLKDANRLCPKKYWQYFDEGTVPKFLNDVDVPGKKYGFVMDREGRPLAGLAAYFDGVKNNDYLDETLPYLWEVGSVTKSKNTSGKQVRCKFAQKGVGTALVKDFAKKVDYKFWFKSASGSADSYWQHVVKSGKLGKVIKLYYLGRSTWGDPEYSTVEPDEKLINCPNK